MSLENPFVLDPDLASIYAALSDDSMKRLFRAQAARARVTAAHDRVLPWSIARAIDAMMIGSLDGPEREFFQETAKAAGRAWDPQRIVIPFACLKDDHATRDLTAANAGAGGYLVSTRNTEAQDMLRPWSTTLRAGVTWLENLQDNQVMPKLTAGITITWQSAESVQITPSTPTLAQVALGAKTAIGIVQCSRQFMRQANPDRFIRNLLLKTAGTAADQAVLNGSGASGQPLGILNTPGLGTQSGTSLAWTGALSMKRKAADANAQDGAISFIATPAVRELLEGRARDATNGSGFIWQDNAIASCPAYATTDMPTGSMLAGPMPEVFFGIWGPGVVVEVHPYADFRAALIQFRVALACDVGIGCAPAAFTKATTIT